MYGGMTPTSNAMANRSSARGPHSLSTQKAPHSSKRKRDSSKSLFVCPICLEVMLDASTSVEGQDAIFCDGKCKARHHRGCAGMSKAALAEASKSPSHFLCLHSYLESQDMEIHFLTSTTQTLVSEVSVLKDKLATFSPSPSVPSVSQCENVFIPQSYSVH